MGNAAYARIAYGYDLGGQEDEWKVEQVDEYGGLKLDWLDDETSGYFVDLAEKRLLVASGFTETSEERKQGYYQRLGEAQAALGVTFTSSGHHDYSGNLLVTRLFGVEWSNSMALDLQALASEEAESDWDAKLARAVEALGITPTQGKPCWLLHPYYG